MVNTRISCVICAYNEEPRIKNVLEAVANNPLFSEVIVVDDGSKDGTAEVVEKYKNVKLVRHGVNQGKSKAFVTGASAATGKFIMMLDADLVGLSNTALEGLAEPVLSGKADVAISLRSNSLFIYKWLGIDYISGERIFQKSLLEGHLEKMSTLPSYGLESYINELIIDGKLRLASVLWRGVVQTTKADKVERWSGLLGDSKMFLQIIRLMKLRTVIRQIWTMTRMAKANMR
ncbi:hypothetical protein A2662_03210 [Candidatus Giovannonibacteria bacterium RIFCSPHIGHO2_01_FULL_45_33]|uniref:Glycosyltransferase 2-like domain-containing protein n=1 Tax=Candidatus Giovannonibacteria bacterium RIFCSPLOWO2_01_FULL_45_34 TaxID=1798351 RepID=A0A1F5WZK7_9BACT|nr:MAG: hypothetical protein A2662_03210 [Candidatus Giovannonibacteria bacterium RIFCSPHIGHO2_01_FULL_45_33]OGF69522.1 MAG: hypothetical protein A3C73_04945 [Candidatus Giovannonibacteria bacterium RIFCSPHIGHO2_02_FULL_44_11]OGF81082.1 MAG: hypothetical protein A2930_00735 [Candidatus Giovannonibacteria bacterium RIFCSPLOWO2_01_FULL_45_34]